MSNAAFDLLLRNCRVATMKVGAPYGVIDDGAIGIRNGLITWLGKERSLPSNSAKRVVDLEGRWVTPGLIDCHTHLVFGGNRASEFELRLKGATYQDISLSGGGIASTVNATRAASEHDLVEAALGRLNSMLRDGVTTIEIKNGYGLDLASEQKMLRVARKLGEIAPVRVTTTYLGLHTLPHEYAGRADDYVDHVIATILPAIAEERLADAVDAYVEPIAFTATQAERFFSAARALGLPSKVHAEQLSLSGGAALAATTGALSADHLEYADAAAVQLMREAGVTAVLLPGAYLCLRESQLPPIELLRNKNMPMAIATDCNPGTSPLTSLLLAMNLACTLFHLTPEEALQGTTFAAAKALGLADSRGRVDVGMQADLAVWDVSHPAELAYWLGHSPLHSRYVAGVLCPPAGASSLR